MKEDHAHGEDQGCDEEPSSKKAINGGEGESEGNEDKKKGHWLSDLTKKEKIEVWFAAIGALIAMSLFATAATQCSVTSSQLETSNRLAKESKRANDLRENSDRAYVFVMPGILYHVHENGLPQSYLGLSNSGLTVAKNVVSSVGIRILRPPGPDIIEDLGTMRIREEGVMVAHPRVPHQLIRELVRRQSLTPGEIKEIRTGAKRVYVFGLVTYDDIYGRGHNTEFCFMYYGREYMVDQQRGDGYYDTQAKYCKEHNKDD